MPKIIISYRRRNSNSITGRIFDRLVGRYGRDAVFRDVDSIPPGIDFRAHIADALRQSDILLAIVGPRWAGRSAKRGRSKISDEDDFVRIEVETALQRGIPVIPVLLGNTKMPGADQVPGTLKDFVFRNAVRVDPGQDFEHHLGRLTREMDRILADKLEIGEPVVAMASKTAGIKSMEAKVERSMLSIPDKPSIAVLAFTNISGDPEQEYFADGVVEEIITALARLPSLFVIARNSSFTFKGKAVEVKKIAAELGVRFVLEGSVRKAGNLVRINGQLIDTITGAYIWASNFDGALDDIFALQDKVASSVAGAIEPKLRLAEMERAIHKPTESLGAYDLFLRALAQVHKMTPQSITEAIALSHQALQLDSSYAAAGGVVAWCRGIQRGQGWILPGGAEDEDGIQLGRLAIEFGGGDPDALSMAALGLAVLSTDHTTALSALERALLLNPNSAHAWGGKAFVESFLGGDRAASAVEAFNKAIRLSPLDPLNYLYKFAVALAYLGAGQYQTAIRWVDDSLRERPRFVASYRVKVALCGLLDQKEEGREWLDQLLSLQPGLTIDAWLKHAATFLAPTTRDLMVEGYRKAGLPES